MNIKALSLVAAVLLLAGCADDTKTTAATGGTSATTSPATGGSTTSTAIRPGSAEDFKQNVGDRVFFAFDKSDIASEGQQTLAKQAAWLKQYPNVTLTVEGHCDERGTREYNLALGERRANSVKKALVALGIPANRVSTISYGKERPAVVGSNDAAYSQNRRGVSVVN